MRFDNEFFYDVLRKIRDVRVRVRGAWVKNANKRSLLMLAAISIPLAVVYFFVMSAPTDFPVGDIITIESGSSLTAVTQQLEDQRIVRHAVLLRLFVTAARGEESVVAGDYQFSRPANIFSVMNTITTGAFGLVPVRIRIPEGSTVAEMTAIYRKYLPKFDPAAFARDATPLEGYLFPDTYFFLPNANEAVVIRTMRSNFELQVAAFEEDIVASGKSIQDIVTMASLVEKEARIYEDRQKIAGVLWRRIKINMPLQVDAAFLYILGRTTFDLTLKDLQVDSPYNTYRNKGLPPGAINNPGLNAIKAVINPIDTGALFYLADNNGVTHFSKTYEQHLQLKQLYLGP